MFFLGFSDLIGAELRRCHGVDGAVDEGAYLVLDPWVAWDINHTCIVIRSPIKVGEDHHLQFCVRVMFCSSLTSFIHSSVLNSRIHRKHIDTRTTFYKDLAIQIG